MTEALHVPIWRNKKKPDNSPSLSGNPFFPLYKNELTCIDLCNTCEHISWYPPPCQLLIFSPGVGIVFNCKSLNQSINQPLSCNYAIHPYITWLLPTSCDSCRHHVTLPDIILLHTSCDYFLHHVTLHYIMRLFPTSCEFSLYHATIPCIMWLFTISWDYFLHHATLPDIIWLFLASCDSSLYQLTVPYIMLLFPTQCDSS